MVTPTGSKESCQINALKCPPRAIDSIENISEYFALSNAENENPGALAGATGIDHQDWLVWLDNNLKRESAARALSQAVADCDPADRLPFLETLIDALRQGEPSVGFGPIMAEARDWAAWASRAELKAYCLAAYEAMSGRDQAAFLGHLDRRAAA